MKIIKQLAAALVCAVALATGAAIAADDEFANADQVIQQHCRAQWPDNFEMREYCERRQHEALDKLRASRPRRQPAKSGGATDQGT